jgi:hypothetical protein|tara:strand:+ start:255 stop:443 length:189 start_codon:yes stop_codon:yes gene_type:complete
MGNREDRMIPREAVFCPLPLPVNPPPAHEDAFTEPQFPQRFSGELEIPQLKTYAWRVRKLAR